MSPTQIKTTLKRISAAVQRAMCALDIHDYRHVSSEGVWAYTERCAVPGCGHENDRSHAGGGWG